MSATAIVPLSRIAHARSGDKGDASNVGLVALSPALYEVIVREVIKQLDELLATKPEQSPFGAPTERDADPRFRAAYQAVIRDPLPSLARSPIRFLVSWSRTTMKRQG